MTVEERKTADDPPPAGGCRWLFGNARFDERSLELSVDGTPVSLEPKSLEVLRQLLYRAGEVVTKDELLETVWPGRVLSESVLAKSVSRIREVLADDQQTLIKTVHGYGYRFVAPVTVEAARAAAPPRLDLKPGDHPPQRPLWSLVERLGAGGQGEVWLVRHDKTREQRVCKFALDGAGLTAIKREITLHRYLRDTLGERDDFVRFIDWNLDEPPCFVELEYAQSGNLETWAAAQGGIATIDLPTRLDIVTQIADALAAAHSVGVLHKDLKPTNILVAATQPNSPQNESSLSTRQAGGEGRGEGGNLLPSPLAEEGQGEGTQPFPSPRARGEGQGEGRARAAGVKQVPIKLTDFGSATLADATRLDALDITRLGFTKSILVDSAHATPLYLAPEVMAGQPATVQADLYALGVILYQLVVGDLKRPLASGWELHVEDPLLREDIALAVAGDPARRIGDAAALATRLRTLDARHRERAAQQAEKQRLEQERQEATERARLAELVVERFRARRKWMLTTLAVLIVGFALSISLYFDSRRSRNDAAASAASSQAVADFLSKDLFSVVTDRPLKELTVRELLDAASQTLAQRPELTPEAAAQIHASLGNAFFSMEAFAEAREHFVQSQTLYAALGTSHAIEAVTIAAQTVLTDIVLGRGEEPGIYARILDQGRHSLGSHNAAVLKLRHNIAVAKFIRGDWSASSEEFMSVADDAKAASNVDRLFIGEVNKLLGQSLLRLGHFGRAEQVLQEMISAARTDQSAQFTLAQLLEFHAATLIELERYGEAEKELKQALIDIRRWVPTDDSPRITSVDFVTGVLKLRQGEYLEAIDILEGVSKVFAEFKAGPEPATFLTRAYLEAGQLQKAESTIRNTLEGTVDSIWSNHPLHQNALITLADILLQQGELTEAADTLATVDRSVLDRIGPDHPFMASLRRIEGLLAAAEGRLPDAQAALQDALRIQALRYGPSHGFTARARTELAQVAKRMTLPSGQHRVAEPRR